jgi:sulfonate transport system permease protein
MSEIATGTGTGPVTDAQGRPLVGLNHLTPAHGDRRTAGDGPVRTDEDPRAISDGTAGTADGWAPEPDSASPRGHGRRRRSRLARAALVALGVVVPLAIVVVWHLVTTGGLVPAHQLPSPGSVVDAGVDLWQRGQFQVHVAISAQRVLAGFAIGSLLGLALGSLVGLSRWFAAAFAPTIGAIRAVPSLAWVPLLILWIGINEDSKVTLVTIGAFFPVFTTVAGALRHVDPHLVEAGRAFGLRGLQLLRTVQLPAVVPTVVSGLRLALAQAWLFVVAAELIASSMGLGFLIIDSANNGRVDRMLLAIVSFAILGKLTDSLIGLGEKHLLKRWT